MMLNRANTFVVFVIIMNGSKKILFYCEHFTCAPNNAWFSKFIVIIGCIIHIYILLYTKHRTSKAEK